jgi:hypothetical protein
VYSHFTLHTIDRGVQIAYGEMIASRQVLVDFFAGAHIDIDGRVSRHNFSNAMEGMLGCVKALARRAPATVTALLKTSVSAWETAWARHRRYFVRRIFTLSVATYASATVSYVYFQSQGSALDGHFEKLAHKQNLRHASSALNRCMMWLTSGGIVPQNHDVS